jgi:hypothetical protein
MKFLCFITQQGPDNFTGSESRQQAASLLSGAAIVSWLPDPMKLSSLFAPRMILLLVKTEFPSTVVVNLISNSSAAIMLVLSFGS